MNYTNKERKAAKKVIRKLHNICKDSLIENPLCFDHYLDHEDLVLRWCSTNISKQSSMSVDEIADLWVENLFNNARMIRHGYMGASDN